MNNTLHDRLKSLRHYYYFFLFILSMVLLFSLAFNLYSEYQFSRNAALEHAKSSFTKDLTFRTWIASHGGVYVTTTEMTPPNPYLSHIEDRDLVTPNGKKLTLMNPAYVLRQLMENYEGAYGAKGHITSLKLLNPNNKASQWETKALKRFEQGVQDEIYEFINTGGNEFIYYMKALEVKTSCLKCHAHQGYKVGDIRGGLSIVIPMDKYNRDFYQASQNLLFFYTLFAMLLMTGLFYSFKYLKRSVIEQDMLEQENQRKDEIMLAQSHHAAMGEMISLIAHQWRQPITAISMRANNLLADVEFNETSNQSVKEQSKNILDQTEYLSSTIDDFRNFFRPNKEKDNVQLEEMIHEAEKIISNSLEHNNIQLIIKTESGRKINIFSREILQVYINLLKNAKEAITEKKINNGRIDVLIYDESSGKNDYVTTCICDNAGGIDEAIIDRIFDPYFTTKSVQSGTGLGLYMSKTIVEKHFGGQLTVNNAEQGACFKVAIPVTR
ncbi:MAG: DUF3365 domain-containing protein [Gammaproteobacteria bacterium]|nr:DUF3365 domain-containing protein [Gammaproteobacteria bacterium]